LGIEAASSAADMRNTSQPKTEWMIDECKGDLSLVEITADENGV
jgi:hypothetical protein